MNSYLLVPSLNGKESDMLETYVLRGGLQARPSLKERIRERPMLERAGSRGAGRWPAESGRGIGGATGGAVACAGLP